MLGEVPETRATTRRAARCRGCCIGSGSASGRTSAVARGL
jgi:hypothetical protein